MNTLLGCYLCYMVATYWQVWGQGHEDRQKASLYARTTCFRLCSGSSGIRLGHAGSFFRLSFSGNIPLGVFILKNFLLWKNKNVSFYNFITQTWTHVYMSVHVLWHEHMALHVTRCLSVYNLRTYLFSLHFDNSPLHPFPHPIELPLLPIFMSYYLFVTQST